MEILSIGRSEECNIILPDSMISRRHAILKIYPTGKMEIVDMGQNGTFVNGVRLAPNVPYPVSRKDVISFAHRRQLDWTQVPDNYKLYRYILLGVAVAACVIGIAFVIGSVMGNTKSQLPVDNSVEILPPYTPKENPEPEQKVEDVVEEEVKPENKKSNIPDFFPEEKKKVKNKKAKKKPEGKEEKPQEPENDSKPEESLPAQTMPVL